LVSSYGVEKILILTTLKNLPKLYWRNIRGHVRDKAEHWKSIKKKLEVIIHLICGLYLDDATATASKPSRELPHNL